MRFVCLSTVIVSCIQFSAPMFGQGPVTSLSVTNYRVVSERRLTPTQSELTFRADLVSQDATRTAVRAKLKNANALGVHSIPGRDALLFRPARPGRPVASDNTFTLLVNPTVPLDVSSLQWVLLGPVADAGPSLTAKVGSTVTLNGSQSSSSSGPLTYSWALTFSPPGSSTVLVNPSSVTPSFAVDVAGTYVITLTVSDGTSSDSARVIVSTVNTAPVANAGPDQNVALGSRVILNGSASGDVDGNLLTYSWRLLTLPDGSNAALSGANTVSPAFVADQPGAYTAVLTVNDGNADSNPATVTISTGNIPPVANAGVAQFVSAGALVQLDGSCSSDLSGDALNYYWSLINLPDGSAATLSNPGDVNPTFIADLPGTYVAQLVVGDGTVASNAATVLITTQNAPPVASAGSDQAVSAGTLVQLDGSGSTDVAGNSLTYQWSLIAVPAGSGAKLSQPTAVNPTFQADLPGTYIAQLIVNDGTFTGAPATVTISTDEVLPPTANAGLPQSTTVKSAVKLSGAATDPQGMPVAFDWALIGAPAGSAAALSSNNIASPTFVADLQGTYVAQLIANNGVLISPPATVVVTTGNTRPVANAGPAQIVGVTANVTLNGSGSVDADNDSLTYSWVLITRPAGSAATLTASTTVSPSFVADVGGAYVAQLTVNDGLINSNPATVLITTTTSPIITLAPNPLSLAPNASGTLTVKLSAPAGASGQVVNLVSSNPKVAAVPATAGILAGATTASITVTSGQTGSASIAASALGFAPANVAVSVATPGISITLSSATVGFSTPVDGTVTLSAPAPTGGVVVMLAATPTGIVDVEPSSLTIAAGSATATFTVTALAVGSASIAASSTGYTGVSTNVSVSNSGQISLPTSASLVLGQSAPFPVTLLANAPAGGVTITLASSDPTRITITPSSVFIAAGATSPTTQPQINGVNVGPATISASATGFIPAGLAVRVTATIAFSQPTLTVTGVTTQNLTLNLSAPVPSPLTISLSSENPSIAKVPANVIIAAKTSTVSVPVTGVTLGTTTIHASALPNIADTSASVTVVTAGTILVPSAATVGLGKSTAFQVGLPAAAAANGTTITLATSDPTIVTITPATVFIPAGQITPAAQPQISGINFGMAKINASAPGYTSTSTPVVVDATLTFFPPSVTITGIATQNLTLNLSAPAPAAGLTVSLSSTTPAVATVPASVTFAPNANSVTVPVNSVTPGTTTIHASALPNAPDTTAAVTVVSAGTIVIPANLTVAPGQSVPFPVTLPLAAPAGGTTVTLTSSDTTKLTVTPATVLVAAGATSPITQPTITGVNFGTAAISAAAPGYTKASQQVQVTVSLSFSPATLAITGTGTQNLTLNLSVAAPSAGLTVNLSSTNTAVATVPATVTFPANATSATVAVTGISPGTAIINASALPNIADTIATVTVNPVVTAGGITVNTAAVGQNLQTTVGITLPQAAPSTGLQVTLTSSDPTKLLVSQSATGSGSGSLVVAITPGASSFAVTVQALGSTGTVFLTASAPGYTSGSGSIALYPSGFILYGPGGIGVSTFSVAQGLTAPLDVSPARLDTSFNYIEVQPLRGGFSAIVKLTDSTTSVGTLQNTSLTFNGGADTVATQFTGVSSGSATLTASAPTGFSVPTGANALTATVTPSGLVPGNVTVGKNLEVSTSVALNGVAPAAGLLITVTSNSPAQLLLSTTQNGTGSASITLSLPPGAARSPNFYVYGLANSGSPTYTVVAPGFGNAIGTVTLGPSGIIISGPFGVGVASFPTTTGAGPSTVTVYSALLDTSGNVLNTQAIAGGIPLTASVSSSSPGIGTVVPSAVTIAAGSSTGITQFQPASAGSTTLSVSAPTGFSTPAQYTSVTATVTTPGMSILDGDTIGQNLQDEGAIGLGQVPFGNVPVTLTSNNPSLLLLSATPTGTGSASITVTVPAGTLRGSYYLRAIGNSGTATYTATAPGYASRTATVTLAPSGIVLASPYGLGFTAFPFSIAVANGPTPFTIYTAQLNSDNSFGAYQELAGGTSISVSLSSSNAGAGTISSPVTIAGGTSSATATFTPVTAGSTAITVGVPTGFTAPSNDTTVSVTVH
jgi:PKD domain-containing protein/K319-like protein